MADKRFDDVVSELGEFGTYQKRVYFLLCLPAITTCMQTLMTVFTMATPDHRCAIPGLDNDSYHTQDSIHAAMISKFIPDGDSCHLIMTSDDIGFDDVTGAFLNATPKRQFDSPTFNASQAAGLYSLAGNGGNVSVSTQLCSRFVYNKSVFKETLITELDLVCSKKHSRATAQTVMMSGNLIGAIAFGAPADYVGRKKMLMVSLVLHMTSALAVTWATYFPVFCCLLFLQGAAITACFANSFCIGMELVGPRKRVWAGYVMEIFWSFGMILLTPMAYLLRDWQHLQLATSILPFGFLSYFWLIPESPRWLLSKGRVEEAEVILRRAARVNKVKLAPDVLDSVCVPRDRGQSVLTMFKHPVLVSRCAVIFYTWFVSSLAFYGLGLNVGSLGGSIYVNFLLSGVMELVAYTLCILLLDRIGRRRLNSSLMLLAGVACTLTVLTVLYAPPAHQWTTTALAMIGKLGISGGFATVWVYSSELFPTLIRNSGMGVSSAFARIGMVVCPFVANLSSSIGGDTGTAVPLVIFGVSSILAGLLLLTLPETLNRRLPDTVMDAVNFTRCIVEEESGRHSTSSSPTEQEKLTSIN